jgi:DNA-directed RNA polymerase subunit RPC12/RpoP
VIDSVLNLLFRCAHRRLTRPVTPVSRSGEPTGGAYVVCLACGKQFSYDTKEMRIGKALDAGHNGGVLHPEPPPLPPAKKLRYAMWASVPLAVAAGVALAFRKREPGEGPRPDSRKR